MQLDREEQTDAPHHSDAGPECPKSAGLCTDTSWMVRLHRRMETLGQLKTGVFVICLECGGEMSKKWHPKSAGEVETDCVVLWSCSVCGNQLTRGAMKLAGKDRQNARGAMKLAGKDHQKAADFVDSVPTNEYLLQR